MVEYIEEKGMDEKNSLGIEWERVIDRNQKEKKKKKKEKRYGREKKVWGYSGRKL